MVQTTPLEKWIQHKIVERLNEQNGLSRTLIEEYQLERLQQTIEYARTRSAFYRDRLRNIATETISSFTALKTLPFTTAQEVRENPMRFVCCSQDEIERIVTLNTSGTTGIPKRIFFTKEDQELTKDFFHHALGLAATPGDKVLVLLPGDRPGSVGELFTQGARRMGVVPVPHGFVRNPEATLEIVERENIDVLLGIPVQVLALAAYEPPEENHFRTRIKSVILNTDHVPETLTAQIRGKWNCRVFNHYAMTEMGLGGGIECEAFTGYHLREADLLFEIINPETEEPVADSEEGEIVFTTLTRKAMPFIRYRTGDMARFLQEPCPCGTVLKTMVPVKERLSGRVLLATGEFLTISMIDEALFSIPGVLNFRAVLSSEGSVDHLMITVQVARWVDATAMDKIHNALYSVLVIREGVRQGFLKLGSVSIDYSSEVWNPTKRRIQDLRNEETK